MIGIYLMMLYIGKSLKYLRVISKKTAHGDEGPHDADIYVKGCW